ncbi:MAG: nitroreductase [Burkholderiaceae bacterium]
MNGEIAAGSGAAKAAGGGLDAIAAPTAGMDAWAFAQALIHSRQTVMPRRLQEPGPDARQLHELLALAAAAPDHGQLTPWRFVVVPKAERDRLAEAFALALTDRDPDASAQQVAAAREKAHRAPLLMVVVACLGARDPDIPALERLVSVGAAVQNLLLGAHALGFGTGLTSGKAMASTRLRALLGLPEGEVPVCCVNIGTVTLHKPRQGKRPAPAQFTSTLGSA